MPRKIIILENIRSAYNVGNVIRTADALGREVRITGYTPSPLDHPKVKKTSLGAEDCHFCHEIHSYLPLVLLLTTLPTNSAFT